MIPEDRKYTKTHEWIQLEDDLAVVGITDFAQQALGDITFIDLPEAGTTVHQGEECGVIESVKAASDIYAPVDGEVVEVNQLLVDRPELMNTDPHEDGWVYRIKIFDMTQFNELIDAEEYRNTQKDG